MVAAPVSREAAAANAAAQAANPKVEERKMWAPRTGLTDAYEDWLHETLMRIAPFGFESIQELIEWVPPTQDQFATAQPGPHWKYERVISHTPRHLCACKLNESGWFWTFLFPCK